MRESCAIGHSIIYLRIHAASVAATFLKLKKLMNPVMIVKLKRLVFIVVG